MRRIYILIIMLALASIVITLAFIAVMPDRVPMHYDLNGNADRIGSKYENLIFPVIIIVLAVLTIVVVEKTKKSGHTLNSKYLVISGIVLLVFFNIIFSYFLYRATYYNNIELSENSFLYKISGVGFGIMFIVLGMLMPKTSLNPIIGLRTRWSMSNPRVWAKSQKAGGIMMAICGVLMIAVAILFDKIAVLIAVITLAVFFAGVSIAVSYIVYKSDIKLNNKKGHDMKKILFYGMTGEKMCFQHILLNALDLAAAGNEVKIIFEGASVKLVPVFEEENNMLYKKAKESGLIAGICFACSKVMEVYEQNLSSGLTMINDMNGHAGMNKYIENGYSVISM